MTENLIKSLFFLNFSETINGFALFLIKGIARKQVFRLLNRQFSLIRRIFVTEMRRYRLQNEDGVQQSLFCAELAVQGLATSVICTEAQVFP